MGDFVVAGQSTFFWKKQLENTKDIDLIIGQQHVLHLCDFLSEKEWQLTVLFNGRIRPYHHVIPDNCIKSIWGKHHSNIIRYLDIFTMDGLPQSVLFHKKIAPETIPILSPHLVLHHKQHFGTTHHDENDILLLEKAMQDKPPNCISI